MLPNLLGHIPAEDQLASVSGDGAYDTKGCHEAIALRQADAIIPILKNAKPWKMDRTGAAASVRLLCHKSVYSKANSSLPYFCNKAAGHGFRHRFQGTCNWRGGLAVMASPGLDLFNRIKDEPA